jgi:hypothetical protein
MKKAVVFFPHPDGETKVQPVITRAMSSFSPFPV